MHLLLSCPSEVLVQIIQGCDNFLQLVCLVSTCKRLRSVWTAHAGSIIRHVGERTMFAFGDALLAVRATEIVKIACKFGTLPPTPFPLDHLSGAVREPSLQELREVLNLQHMMRCIECMLLHWEKRPSTDFFYPPEFVDLEYLAIGEVWKENFYRSMYRVVFAGAAFAGAYNEPFFLAAREWRTEFLELWAHWATDEEIFHGTGLRPSEDDVECLRKFPVYNCYVDDQGKKRKWRDREYETIFGPFAEWIVQDGMTRGKTKSPRQDSDRDFDSAQENAVGDVMRLVAAYEHLSSKIANQDETSRSGRDVIRNEECKISGNVRKVSVVLFGVFQVEEITMPAKIEDSANIFLIANPGIEVPEENERQTTGGHIRAPSPSKPMDISLVLQKLTGIHERLGNHHDSPAPPPILQLFIFIARKYFNLRFSELAFSDWVDRPYLSLAEPQIFSDGESGYGVLEPS